MVSRPRAAVPWTDCADCSCFSGISFNIRTIWYISSEVVWPHQAHTAQQHSNSLHTPSWSSWDKPEQAVLFVTSWGRCPLTSLPLLYCWLKYFVIHDESDLVNDSFTQMYMSINFRETLVTGGRTWRKNKLFPGLFWSKYTAKGTVTLNKKLQWWLTSTGIEFEGPIRTCSKIT